MSEEKPKVRDELATDRELQRLQTSPIHREEACVDFCEHIPTETLEKLLEAKVGAATFIQWLKRNPTWTLWDEGRAEGEELYEVCIECDHRVGQTGLHAEDCLLPKALELTGDV